jgi:hypothetical protein
MFNLYKVTLVNAVLKDNGQTIIIEVKDVKENYKFINAWDCSKLQPSITECDSVKCVEHLLRQIGDELDVKLLVRIKRDGSGNDMTYFNIISMY